MSEKHVMPTINLTVAGKDQIPPLALVLFDDLEEAGVTLTSDGQEKISNALIRVFFLGARAGIGEFSASLENAGLGTFNNHYTFDDPDDDT